MKKVLFVLAVCIISFAGCDKGGGGLDEKQIELPNKSEEVQTAFADDETTGGFTFVARSAWTATVTETTSKSAVRASNVEWLRLLLGDKEAYGGGAGTIKLVIELVPNFTGNDRAATITVKSGKDQIAISVSQKGKTSDGKVPENPIQPIAVTAIEFDETYKKVELGASTELEVTVLPADATDKSVEWTVSPDGIISIDSDKRTITAVAVGKASITVHSVAYPNIKNTCEVEVYDNSPDPAPSNKKVVAINGMNFVFDKDGYVIGRGSEVFADQYTFEGSVLGGGGPIKTIKGQGADIAYPVEHKYGFAASGYISKIDYILKYSEPYKEGEVLFTWGDDGNLNLIREVFDNGNSVRRTELEYTEVEHPQNNLDVNIFVVHWDGYNVVLGPYYYMIFDNNLGNRSKHLVTKAKYSMEGNPAHNWDHERSFRYEYYDNGNISRIYYTDKWAHESEPRAETYLCQLYYQQ